jgi:lactoylglutathione lyase
MKIEHIALWTEDIDRLVGFYGKYFQVKAGSRYRNASKGFESCFLSFSSGTRLEVMSSTRESFADLHSDVQSIGLAHFAIAVGSEQRVDTLTSLIQSDGFQVLDGPRRTGDGYYESVVLDPDGNRIEITV